MLWSRDQEFGRATVQQLALEEARTRTDPTLAATVTATVDYWPCPARPLPLGTVVLMLSRGLQPGRAVANEMDPNAAKLGQYMLRWVDGDPPASWVLPDPPSADRIPRRPWLATTTVEIGIGDWWPGRYPLLCRVHELGGNWGPRDDPARVPLGKALSDLFRSELTVKIDQKRFPWLAGRPANGLPIEETNLMAAIPKPTATTVDLTAGIPFTLGETGYPILLLPSGQSRATAELPDVRTVDERLRGLPVFRLPETVFSPVHRIDADDPDVAHRGIGTAAPTSQAISRRQAALARGAGENAAKAADPESRLYGLEQAVKTAVVALRSDPNNLQALSSAARYSALAGNMPQAFGLFLTLVFRLRIIERMLLEMTGPYWKRQRVRALESVRGLPDVFWTDVATLAGLLQLQGVLALDFSGLRHASVG